VSQEAGARETGPAAARWAGAVDRLLDGPQLPAMTGQKKTAGSARGAVRGGCRGGRSALWAALVAVLLWVAGAAPARAFDLFGREVTAQFATADGKPMANAEVRVFAPGAPAAPTMIGHADAEGKFVFSADRDGFWSAEARGSDGEIARVMVRVGHAAPPREVLSPEIAIGGLFILLMIALWYRLRRSRRNRPRA